MTSGKLGTAIFVFTTEQFPQSHMISENLCKHSVRTRQPDQYVVGCCSVSVKLFLFVSVTKVLVG